jgi:hypothetical protein
MSKVDVVVITVGDAQDTSAKDIAAANNLLKAATTVHVRRREKLEEGKLTGPDYTNMKGPKVFYESNLGDLVAASNLTCETDCIDVYYVRAFYSKDVCGVTVRPKGQPEGYKGLPPIRPVIVLNAAMAGGQTLAHELGHALLDSGAHEASPDNLMCAGGNRKGGALTDDQIKKIKGSQYVR